MNVTSLNIFPLKSGSGITVDRVKALNTGLQGDREFVLMDKNGNFLSAEIPSKHGASRSKAG